MKKTIYLHSLLIMLLFAACTKTNVDNRYVNKRVVGEYIFEKVTVNEGFLDNKNITSDYHNMKLQLNDKHEAALIDEERNIIYTGDWEVLQDQNYSSDDDDGNDNSEYIIIINTKGGRGQTMNFYGENADLGLHKLKFEVDRVDGKYKYKLDKL